MSNFRLDSDRYNAVKDIILNTYNIIPNIMSRPALIILIALLFTAVVCEEDKYKGPSE